MKRTNTAVWMEKQKRWQIKVQKDGEQRSFYSSKPGRTGQWEANAKADAWLDEGIEGTGKRVEELFNLYLDEKKMTVSKSYWRNIEQYGRLHILPKIKYKKIETIAENDFQRILNEMYAKGMSKKTISNVRAVICEFCKYCRHIKASTLNPEFLTIPKGASKKDKIILQKKDLQVLFTSSKTLYKGEIIEDIWINAYRFQVLTGLRPGELFGLRWDDIWDDTVHIRRSINIYGEVTKGKNENARRNFLLIPLAKKILQEQWALTGGREKSVFGITSARTYHKRLKVYCRHNNLPEVSPYELRHTFVSVVKQLPEGIIKPLVGHSEDMDTLGIYAHEMEDDFSLAAGEVERLFEDVLQSGL